VLDHRGIVVNFVTGEMACLGMVSRLRSLWRHH